MTTPSQVKKLSNETLLKHASVYSAEIKRRVDTLVEGQKELGVKGLEMQKRGVKRALCKFPNASKQYVYDVPEHAEVGDVVRTPTNIYSGPSLATIIRFGDNGYTGHVKEVTEIYKKGNQ